MAALPGSPTNEGQGVVLLNERATKKGPFAFETIWIWRGGVALIVIAAGVAAGLALRAAKSAPSPVKGPEQVIISSAIPPAGADTALSVTWVVPYGSSFSGEVPFKPAMTPNPVEVVPRGGKMPVNPRVLWGNSSSSLTCQTAASMANYTYATTGVNSVSSYSSPVLLNATIGGADGGGLNCTLPVLAFNQSVYYQVGDDANGWTEVKRVTTLPAPGAPFSPDSPMRLAFMGDLGTTENSADTLAHIVSAHAAAPFSSLFLIGDLSYADGSQPTWDVYGKLVTRLASVLPWHTNPGNHEWFDTSGYDFKAYVHRYRNPGTEGNQKLYYSLSLGLVHIIMLQGYCPQMNSTHTQPCLSAGSAQLAWLQADLAAVNRAVTPWVIVAFHQPFVNSNAAHNISSEGLPMQAAIERTLYDGGVDLVFSGHVHAYERSCRVFNFNCTGDGTAPYYITIGDAGNREGLADQWVAPQPSWSMYRRASYGHGQLNVLNATHMKWEWHQNPDLWPEVADSFYIIKGDPGPQGPGVTPTVQWSRDRRALR